MIRLWQLDGHDTADSVSLKTMRTLIRLVLILCCASVTGCIPVAKHSLDENFYIKTRDYFLASENSGGGRELHYRSPEGKQKVVWKYVGEVVTYKDTAVFIGDWDGSEEYKGKCYFAVKGDGPVVRLRRSILTLVAKQNGAEPEDYMRRYGDYMLTAKGDLVQIDYSSRFGLNQKDLFINLTWDEISSMVGTLVKTSKPHKDKLNGLVYLE
jgi:hypothetical protein